MKNLHAHWLLVLAVAVLLLAGVGCPPMKEVPDEVITINSECKPVGADGIVIEKLILYDGKLFQWRNGTGGEVTLVFSSHKVLSGSSSVRIAPGTSVTRRVGTLPDEEITWEIWCADGKSGTKAGGGGPPTEKQDPPPTTP